ncbi:hypothetical protein BDY17DRAFT_323994 [Neohortaea acidophila]|uniref:Uncharacterized protein n=1 Tax=Neohortaea acidophila TaxID=245834 RepID=A0A6A6PU79_9PEZI|nr:uncharacterized protein BDY17DRAFT_323994 [Neohortaea acidophila]KAF2483241.1 hypothetical protein BDY17DRAFT_323994 [Neohortaea acidophila]
MAVGGVVTQTAPSHQQFPGSRSDSFSTLPYSSTAVASSPRKLPVFTSIKHSASHDDRRGLLASSSKSSRQSALRSTLRDIDTKTTPMTATTTTTSTSTASLPPAKRTDAQHARLHKRGSSTTSLPISPALPTGPHSTFTTPFATYEEPFPDLLPAPPSASTPKIKPYLRKMTSGSREDVDQGRLDLSKSVSESAAMAGLGITEFAPRTEALPSGRRSTHTRTTSVNSQMSTGSGSFRPTLPFVHPMRQTPNRAYTPQTDASSMDDEERRESSDVVPEEEPHPAPPPLRRRSTSLSSTTQVVAPTPLSQTHTAADLRSISKLTSTVSQTNLSLKSAGRSRAGTNRSLDVSNTPSSRTSLDKSFSLISTSRRSDPNDPQTREDRIRAARRKFEEKEADKDRKLEARQQSEVAKQSKKEERSRRKSEASSLVADQPQRQPRISKARSHADGLRTLKSDEGRITALPAPSVQEEAKSETHRRPSAAGAKSGREEKMDRSGWARFSTWFNTRLCGMKRS